VRFSELTCSQRNFYEVAETAIDPDNVAKIQQEAAARKDPENLAVKRYGEEKLDRITREEYRESYGRAFLVQA